MRNLLSDGGVQVNYHLFSGVGRGVGTFVEVVRGSILFASDLGGVIVATRFHEQVCKGSEFGTRVLATLGIDGF